MTIEICRNVLVRLIHVRIPILISAFAVTIAIGPKAIVPARPRSYTITNIGYLPDCDSTIPKAINNRGQVVGYSYYNLPPGHIVLPHGFIWQDGKMARLRTLGGEYCQALGINDQGDIVGSADDETRTGLDTYDTVRHTWPAMWVAHGSLHVLDWLHEMPLRLPSMDEGWAEAINTRREVVGSAWHIPRPFFWRTEGAKRADGTGSSRMVAVAVPPPADSPGEHLHLVGINRGGTLIGTTYRGGGNLDFRERERAWIRRNGLWTELDRGGNPDGESDGNAIGDDGTVVGWVGNAKNEKLPCQWQNGKLFLLDLAGRKSGEAQAVNRFGNIVGYCGDERGRTLPCLWREGRPIDLNDLIPSGSGWKLYSATGINDKGQIIGEGLFNHRYCGFVLTPK